MGCEACQDCDSSNVTLPTGQVGEKGDTGATGPAGPPGQAGTPGVPGTGGFIILHNDLAQSTTTSNTLALFTPSKSYTLPAGTLSIDGSKLELLAVLSLTSSDSEVTQNIEYQINIGGTSVSGILAINPYKYKEVYTSGDILHMKVRLDISRVSRTKIFITSDNYITDLNGAPIEHNHFTYNAMGVADLDNNDLIFDVRGKEDSSGDTLKCDQLNINHYII